MTLSLSKLAVGQTVRAYVVTCRDPSEALDRRIPPFKVIESDFLLVTRRYFAPVSYSFRDERPFRSKNACCGCYP